MAIQRNTSNAVRPIAAYAIIFGYLFNVAYGFYLFLVLRINFSCEFVIPKLLKYRGVFPAEQFCLANSLLWTALLVFVLNDLVCVAVIVIANRGRKFDCSRRISGKKLSHAIIFMAVILAIGIEGYVYSDLRLARGHFVKVLEVDASTYVLHQVLILHAAVGLANLGLLCLLSGLYRNENEAAVGHHGLSGTQQ
jgi:hypothetical protein